MGFISIKKTYKITVNRGTIKSSLSNSCINMNTANYVLFEASEDYYILKPKCNAAVFHNAFVPQITLRICVEEGEDAIEIMFTLMRSVKILFLIISILMILFELGVLIKTLKYDAGNVMPLLIVPFVYLMQFLITTIGFRISYKIVEKKILNIIK